MSGIVGILNVEGGSIDSQLLTQLASSMAFRGPDAQTIWRAGPVGFGHAMLVTTSGPPQRAQPCSLDESVWIVADARIDAQAELRYELESAGSPCPSQASDAELILHAYRAWSDDCVRHLVGDFAFAIWDGPRQRLFCARDHFGVKPFYYARTADCLVFGNTLGSMRAHPKVADDLNELAIADFLLFGINQDEATTAFANINRLPPAHCMSWSRRSLRVTRYWDLPSDNERPRSTKIDYLGRFMEHLRAATGDRLRSDRIGVLMSGGLDSTSVATVARALLSRQHDEFDLRAYACVYDRLLADDERHFAGLTAQALDIPIHYLVADDYALFERWGTTGLQFPEPADEPLAVIYIDQLAQMAANGRVALTGWDGDALLSESPHGGGRFDRYARFVRSGWRALSQGRWPLLNLRARMKRILSAGPKGGFECPEWLNPELVDSLDLRERWQALHPKTETPAHGHREAYRVLKSPLLTKLLENYDPGVTGIPVEVRHPLLDVRLVEYVLSLPVSPWCVEKHILRMAMRDRLPESVRTRSKTPLAGDPVLELLQHSGARWQDSLDPAPLIGKYVDLGAVPSLAETQDADQVWSGMRPLCLNFWMTQQASRARVREPEEHHEVA